MLILFQNVLNIAAEVKHHLSPYFSGLVFHKGRKTCKSMARGLMLPVKKFYESFKCEIDKIASIKSILAMIAKKISPLDEMRALVIDGTSLAKPFAKKIENLSVDYDGVIKRVGQGLSIMVVGLVINDNIIPLDFSFWYNKKKKEISKRKKNKDRKSANDQYKTKIDLAIDLIKVWKELLVFYYVALDGAFASLKMISFCESESLKYSMRMPRSRKVVINGLELKLSDHPSLKLVRNERCKSAQGFYKGIVCFFTAHKRKKRNGGWEIIFIVSNMELSAKEHVAAYNKRWVIDKSFRTMKQYFGLTDCQMLRGLRQALHVFNVFLAYSFGTIEKIFNKKNCVEDIINGWRNSKKIQNIFETND